jgi:hypothetical protein
MRLRGLPRDAVRSRNGWVLLRNAVANSLFGKKDSLFSAEQGIGRKLLNLLGDQPLRRAKQAGSVQHLQEIPC